MSHTLLGWDCVTVLVLGILATDFSWPWIPSGLPDTSGPARAEVTVTKPIFYVNSLFFHIIETLPGNHIHIWQVTFKNTLTSERCGNNFKSIFFHFRNRYLEHYLCYWLWMPRNPTNYESTLLQVMAWCHQAPNHYLNQWFNTAPFLQNSTYLQSLLSNMKIIELICYFCKHTIYLMRNWSTALVALIMAASSILWKASIKLWGSPSISWRASGILWEHPVSWGASGISWEHPVYHGEHPVSYGSTQYFMGASSTLGEHPVSCGKYLLTYGDHPVYIVGSIQYLMGTSSISWEHPLSYGSTHYLMGASTVLWE